MTFALSNLQDVSDAEPCSLFYLICSMHSLFTSLWYIIILMNFIKILYKTAKLYNLAINFIKFKNLSILSVCNAFIFIFYYLSISLPFHVSINFLLPFPFQLPSLSSTSSFHLTLSLSFFPSSLKWPNFSLVSFFIIS